MEPNRQVPGAVFRSISTNSTVSVNSSTSNIKRVALGPFLLSTMSLNRLSSAEEHMHYKCLDLRLKLKNIKGMEPFLNLAFNSAEQCAEQQALALSQQLDGSGNNDFRASIGSSGFSIYSDTSSGASMTNGHGSNSNSLFTFTAGVLPASLSVDPATQMWKLFQQGAPLCLIFNSVYPEYQIPIVSSDDLRICKKSVYDFLIAVKMYLKFDDDSMFTISNVFLDSTHDLMKIIKVVNMILNIKPISKSSSSDVDHLNMAELSLTEDRKVFKEIVETERKYIQDLELMSSYRDELRSEDFIASEQIEILFPNLNEIIDFQRRFLNGLECNINVAPKYQRIGSVFIHIASHALRAYEAWILGQMSALDIINKESNNLRKSSTLIDPGFELQSMIIKPVQRLCKYPLLLKELLKTMPEYRDNSIPPSASFNELLVAEVSMKEVANKVNEAKRRAENVGHLQSLAERVQNWRGFNLRDQGDLLHHGIVAVRDSESEKEYVAYLFEKIIFFFIAIQKDPKEKEKKKRELLSSKKKSSSSIPSSSTANLLESLNSAKDKSILELKGRVYILEIYNISTNQTSNNLVISWSGKKESGSFSLRYRTDEIRNQWEQCLRSLKATEMLVQRRLKEAHISNETLTNRDSGAYDLSYNSSLSHNTTNNVNDTISLRSSSDSSFRRHDSSSSSFSMMRQARSKSTAEGSRVSSAENHRSSQVSTLLHLIDIKLIYNKMNISEILTVPSTIQFNELYHKISSKIASSQEIHDDIVVNKLRYKDEDGDFVVMYSNDDWNLAIDMLEEMNESSDEDLPPTLNIWVS